MGKATEASSPDTPHTVRLEVMGTAVDVAVEGALEPFESEVRRAWHRCLPAARADAPLSAATLTAARVGPSVTTLPAAGAAAPSATAPRTSAQPGEPGGPGVVRIPALAAGAVEDPCAAALDALSTAVTVEGIMRHRGRSLLFHAAGLADPETGGTTALVASSGTGKTTAAVTLGRALEYVSDETVCVDPRDLRVHPCPKPLSVVAAGGGPKRQVPPGELGLRAVTREGRLRSLVLLERRTGDPANPAPAELSDPLPLVCALSSLVPNISALPSLPRPLSTLVRTLAACGGARAVRYREVDDVADLLARTATAPLPPLTLPEPLLSWTPGPAVADALPGPADRDAFVPLPEQVVLAPWAEALQNPEDPSQLLLLLPDQFLVLDGIAPTVWHACREHGARTPAELAVTLREAHGENPRAAQLTRECVLGLLELGVLRQSGDRTSFPGTDAGGPAPVQ